MRVAFQGQDGAYSQQAVFDFYPEAEAVACPAFDAVFDAVALGDCQAAMIPIENSLAGSIHQNYDLLLRHNLFIVGEHFLRVRHCLIGLPGVKKSEIERAVSHPQALDQCDEYLRRHGIRREVGLDTAGSVALIKERGERPVAAIASRRAAEIYRMNVIEEGIEDDPQNYTRFLAISPTAVEAEGETKTSIVFTLPNRAGTLYEAIGVFGRRNLDLTKIESRPLAGTPWDYFFYLDFIGDPRAARVNEALNELATLAPMLRVLGSYARFQ
ncbi:MAG: P-protein [Anaerolineales bacterium]|nr:P-protein [Anaerolineales bacterium]